MKSNDAKELARILLMHATFGILHNCGNSYANKYTEEWLEQARSLGAYHGLTTGSINELTQNWNIWLDNNGGLPDWENYEISS